MVYGNPHSMIGGGSIQDWCFAMLFSDCKNIVDASKLLLSSTTLAYSCYSNMFSGCTALTAAPDLPATTLAENCYADMFR